MTTTRRALLSEEFWQGAFDESAPFLESYRTTFRDGVVRRLIGYLNLHREAIYYLRDDAVWPVITELLRIAAVHPEADFMESLDYFLTLTEKQSVLIRSIDRADAAELQELLNTLSQSRQGLVQLGDSHLTDGIDWLSQIAARRIQGQEN